MHTYRPGQKIINIGGSNRYQHGKPSGAVSWWLAGGVLPSNCIAAYQPIGAASYAASKANLNNPGVLDAQDATIPAWDTGRGWIFDGYTQALYIMWPPKQENCIIARIKHYGGSGSGITQHIVGAQVDAVNKLHYIRVSTSPNRVGYSNSLDFNYTAPSLSDVTLSFSAKRCFYNGSYVGTVTYGLTDNYTDRIGIGMLRRNGAYYWGFNGDILAIAFYNPHLSDAQVAAVTAAMQAL